MTQRQCVIQRGWQLTELGTWSTVHSPRAAQQIGECLFQYLIGLTSSTFAIILLLRVFFAL